MKAKHIMSASFAFLVIVISAYFGASIHSAYSNDPVSYLNDFERTSYYDIAQIPFLNFQAAIFTLPFLLAIVVVELIIVFKAKIRQVKNLAYGATVAVSIVLVTDVLVLFNPSAFSMSAWGYLWIIMGAIILVSNVISVFVKGNV